ncbi:MAG: hypothetical protein KDC66_19910 [Phaeodactylibacter sp.]|nr:hypothetical protein [Phaeodactylibacter sp.]MCB9273027.1 hypothetical protein [Lewinellaceae bacterium]
MKPSLRTLRLVFLLFYSMFFCAPLLWCQYGKSDRATFYTGISPVILQKDAVEANFTNSLTSFWVAVNEYLPAYNATRVANRYRFSRLEQLARVSYGFSPDARWDLGAELRYTHSRLDDEARSSPFRVFEGDTGSGNTYRGLSYLGLRFRAMPFESLPELTLQANAQFPITRQEELRLRLGAQRTQLGLMGTFYQQFNATTYLFLQAEWRVHLENDENPITTHTPSASAFLVLDLWDQKWYAFPGLTYAMALQKVRSGGLARLNRQFLGSVGLLYQPDTRYGFLFNAQLPFILDSGSFYTEWVSESYSSFTLGIRLWY